MDSRYVSYGGGAAVMKPPRTETSRAGGDPGDISAAKSSPSDPGARDAALDARFPGLDTIPGLRDHLRKCSTDNQAICEVWATAELIWTRQRLPDWSAPNRPTDTQMAWAESTMAALHPQPPPHTAPEYVIRFGDVNLLTHRAQLTIHATLFKEAPGIYRQHDDGRAAAEASVRSALAAKVEGLESYQRVMKLREQRDGLQNQHADEKREVAELTRRAQEALVSDGDSLPLRREADIRKGALEQLKTYLGEIQKELRDAEERLSRERQHYAVQCHAAAVSDATATLASLQAELAEWLRERFAKLSVAIAMQSLRVERIGA
jgi:hypothetical protein